MMEMGEMNDADARSPAIRDRLRHVYWIGGGSGAGKSTVAASIAAKHGFTLYDTDQAMANHGARMAPQDSPLLRQFINMAADQRWVNRSSQVMLETFHWFRGEGFELIVEALLDHAVEQPVIVEGFR